MDQGNKSRNRYKSLDLDENDRRFSYIKLKKITQLKIVIIKKYYYQFIYFNY